MQIKSDLRKHSLTVRPNARAHVHCMRALLQYQIQPVIVANDLIVGE
jgi:hypothetical protein